MQERRSLSRMKLGLVTPAVAVRKHWMDEAIHSCLDYGNITQTALFGCSPSLSRYRLQYYTQKIKTSHCLFNCHIYPYPSMFDFKTHPIKPDLSCSSISARLCGRIFFFSLLSEVFGSQGVAQTMPSSSQSAQKLYFQTTILRQRPK